jgi:hypothetical protein
MSKVRLWQDVPAAERVTAKFIEGCVGARDPEWLQRRMDRLANPLCVAATPWGSSGKWAPCGLVPVEGANLCRVHGGPRHHKSARQKALDGKLASAHRRLARIDEQIAELPEIRRDVLMEIEMLGRMCESVARKHSTDDKPLDS